MRGDTAWFAKYTGLRAHANVNSDLPLILLPCRSGSAGPAAAVRHQHRHVRDGAFGGAVLVGIEEGLCGGRSPSRSTHCMPCPPMRPISEDISSSYISPFHPFPLCNPAQVLHSADPGGGRGAEQADGAPALPLPCWRECCGHAGRHVLHREVGRVGVGWGWGGRGECAGEKWPPLGRAMPTMWRASCAHCAPARPEPACLHMLRPIHRHTTNSPRQVWQAAAAADQHGVCGRCPAAAGCSLCLGR